MTNNIVVRHFQDRHDELGHNCSIVAVFAPAPLFLTIPEYISAIEAKIAEKYKGKIEETQFDRRVAYTVHGDQNYFTVALDDIKINEIP